MIAVYGLAGRARPRAQLSISHGKRLPHVETAGAHDLSFFSYLVRSVTRNTQTFGDAKVFSCMSVLPEVISSTLVFE